MRRLLAPLVLTLALAASGCVGMPEEGPVVRTGARGSGEQADAMTINPLGPREGMSQSEIVRGFLDAMQATPIRYDVARAFLTEAADAEWDPEAETITYTTASAPSGTSQVVVRLEGGHRLDGRGAWQGVLPAAEAQLEFRVVVEDGQFRIDRAPDALVVPEWWFQQRYRQVAVYFFDPTGRILVPDPVFVPKGKTLPSVLVRRLVAGPPAALRDHVRTMVPLDVQPGFSVPVSASGVAEVALTGETTMPTGTEVDLLLAQLAWTLRQDRSISRFRVTLNGTPVQRGGESDFAVASGEKYAPSVAGASTLLYGLRDGLVVSGTASDLTPVSGPLGTVDHGLRSVSPNLTGSQAAGVTLDGTRLVLSSLVGEDVPTRTLATRGTDLLEPAWDFADRLWVADRRPGGSVVSVLVGDRLRPVTVEGITGADVKRLLVSRDGTRLVAVVRRAGYDAVLTSRVVHDPSGRVRAVGPAEDITPVAGDGERIRSIVWRSPTTLVVQHPVTTELSRLRTIAVDGSPVLAEGMSGTRSGSIERLIGTPTPGTPTYAVTADGLVDLTGPDVPIPVADGVSAVDFVG
ncbi:LpqB family beta-propeller domain-containing protein [Nocardioides sp. SYSU D00038]|uniref:LpqB family beta-propeller domain-containing protein n=1 Tax=Nocardioides sp. SYSU D00038 TaxID=2812554 RepID=UPI001968218E|nr:LpqB family beta-propeller domain-containing protein [Nocardioides sp. SYSU D00038]